MSAPSENILTPKGVPQTVTTGRCFHHSADSLDGQPSAKGQSGLIAAHGLGAGRVLVPAKRIGCT